MANKYAVVSGLWSDIATWSDTDGGAGGASVPADGDAVFISAAVNVLMNADLSAYTGLFTVTIRGGATPGMLYFKDGTSGYLKIRSTYQLVGTTSTNRGRLLANSDGVWGNTGSLAFANKAVIALEGTAQVTATNLDIALYCDNTLATSVRTYGQVFAECTVDAGANTLTYTGIAAALPNNTLVRVTAGSGALPAELTANTDYWVVGATGNTIQLATANGGAAIDLSAGGPINVHCGFYGTWGVSGNTLTKTTHGLANNTAVMVKSTGTLPTPLLINEMYYVVSTAANSISLSYTRGGSVITLGGSPSGTLDVYTGSTGEAPGIGGTNPYTSTIVNVLDDVTSDTLWVTTTGHNRIVLVDAGATEYDQQRLFLSAKTATTMTLSAVVDSVQYPNARIWVSSRNVSVRSTGTSSQAIVDYSGAPTLSGVFQCEIINTAGTGTTSYGYGINDGTSHIISGVISGCSIGINYGTSHTVSGVIFGCSYGINDGTFHIISGVISGCIIGINYGTSHTVSGVIFGCSYGINDGPSHTISGVISGCNYGINAGTSHIISGVISGCSIGINYGTSHKVSGVISGCSYGINYGTNFIITGNVANCTYHFGISSVYHHVINSIMTASLVFSSRNTAYATGRILVEDVGGVLNAHKIFDMYGDIIKTACDGAGDAPSVDPDGGNGDCIEVSNTQSNLGTVGMKIFEHRIWVTTSISKTYTYKMQTTYTGLATAGRLVLTGNYLNAGSGISRAIVTNNTGPATRDDDTDWSKTMAVTINPSQTGWITLTLTLYYHESNNELYIWPTPTVS